MSRVFLPHVITDDSALGGSVIERSLRFRSNHYLARTPSGAGSNQMTFSFWIKRGKFGSTQAIFSSGAVNARGHIYFTSDDKLNCQPFNSSGANTNLVVDRVFRDSNAWYHVVLSFNNSAYNDTASTVNVYVNGVSASFTPSVTNTPTGGNRLNDDQAKRIGELAPDSGSHLDGYLAEFNFIDGQVLDPSYFGYTESQTGLWRPKRYEGTYGTNGYHLDFNDNSSVAALGIDKSPNGNDWSVSGVSIDLGTSDDSMIDTPTNNFPTLNPSNRSSGPTLDFANLYFFYNYKPASKTCRTTFRLPKSGKYYWEWENNEASSNPGRWQTGLMNVVNENTQNGVNYDIQGYNDADIISYSFGGSIWFGTTHTSGSWDGTTRSFYRPQRCAWAVDCDTGNVFLGRVADDATTQWWASDGSATGNPSKLLNPTGQIDKDKTHEHLPFISWHDGGAANSTGFAIDVNFGQHAFKGTVPDGFKTLSTANIPPDPTINTIVRPQKHFDTLLYTGTGSSNIVEGLEFSPDMIWVKGRDTNGYEHMIIDSVRGGTKSLVPNSNDTESTHGGRSMTFYPGGVRWNSDSGNCNANGENYVMWCWKAGGAAVTNTNGNITSSVSVNEEAGFSIVSYTGNGSNGQTVGHGLSKAPQWIMIKSRTAGSNWRVWQHKLASDGSKRMLLDAQNASEDASFLNDTAPSSTVFTLGNSDNAWNVNSGTYMAYCWHEVPGYSKFGSYAGNGSTDGTYVHLGFRPAWLMVKRYDGGGQGWNIFDNKRNTFNLVDEFLIANSSNAEATGSALNLDFLSNGIKFRGSDGGSNYSGYNYIYMAFAEQPGTTPFETFPNAR